MAARSPARKQKRKQGRPQKDMPAVGRDALIAATRRLMKTKPPAQITRLDIARAAEVDPALIRYYFGDKSELIVAAVLEAGDELRQRQHASFARPGTPTEKIERRIGGLLETLFEDPSLHHLIIERIIHGKSKQARQLRHDMVFGSVKDLAATIEEGVKAGEFRRVDPSHLFLAMVGVCSYAMAERALFGELMGEAPTHAHLDSYKAFVIELFLNGLAATVKTRKPRLERVDS
jgi:AcrR family transcriptional regulator